MKKTFLRILIFLIAILIYKFYFPLNRGNMPVGPFFWTENSDYYLAQNNDRVVIRNRYSNDFLDFSVTYSERNKIYYSRIKQGGVSYDNPSSLKIIDLLKPITLEYHPTQQFVELEFYDKQGLKASWIFNEITHLE